MAEQPGRRKRQYAGQAYDFGAGPNAAMGGQPPHGGSFSEAPGFQPQQPGYQQPTYGSDYGTPAPMTQPSYGKPAPAVGGYQSPEMGYPATSGSGGVSGITQGMSNMGMGGPAPMPPQAAPQRPHLNQLYPTDLLNQPFSVSELDHPPPAIILPANVSVLK